MDGPGLQPLKGNGLMKRLPFPLVVSLALLFAALAITSSRLTAKSAAPAPRPIDASPINEPDKFAWEVFADINRTAGDGTQNAIWETWASDFDMYGDPNHTPDWNKRHTEQLRLKPITQLELLKQESGENLQPQFIPGQQGGEEVRINKPAFDFIVVQQLWYLEGQVKAFSAQHAINFPVDAREVKAVWMPIKETDKATYHWQYDKTDGKTYGLVALHIISKDLPNWTWATFEHIDNPARCAVLTCRDSFGATPATGKNTQPSAALIALFKSAGLGPEWLNYRLDGTQLNFTDATGRTTLLGNSVIEDGFVGTSSCITCHARSTIGANNGRLSVFAAGRKSFNGTPDPTWFYDNPGAPNEKMKFLQLDFVWSMLNAQSRTGVVTPFSEQLKRGVPLEKSRPK
jgi:hypothetical protein